MRPSYVIPITGVCCRSEVGSKAYNLSILHKHGFNIPDTYCITADAYHRFMNENGLSDITGIAEDNNHTTRDRSSRISKRILGGRIALELQEEIERILRMGSVDQSWAIRSSSNLEDLESLSFAGMYETCLNRRGIEDILESIKRCWASLWSERAIAYREKSGVNHIDIAMPVVIQEMVAAESAGVIFTRNPVSTATDEMVMEYCRGTGEGLVSGWVVPYSCVVDRSTQSICHLREPDDGCLSRDGIVHICARALEIEQCFDCPQDIEWAFDGNRFYILQTRPVSSCLREVPSVDLIWTRANVGEVFPDVVTPLTWTVFQATAFSLPAVPSTDWTAHVNSGIKLIHGRIYIQLKSFLDSFCYLPFVTPEVVSRSLGIKLPPGLISSYTRPKGTAAKLAQCAFILDVLGILPRLRCSVRFLGSPSLAGPDGIEELLQWCARCFRVHMKSTAYAIGAFGLISGVVKKWLPAEAEALLPQLLTGRDDLQTSAQGMSLWHLASGVRSNNALKHILESELDWESTIRHFLRVAGGADLVGGLKRFLEENGCRGAGEFELAHPRWYEDPSYVLDVMRKLIRTDPGQSAVGSALARRDQRRTVVEYIRRSLGDVRSAILMRLVNSYAAYTTNRENVKYRLMQGYAQLRQAFLEIGSALTSRSVLDEKNDIFFMTLDEINAMDRSPRLKRALLESIRDRKAERVQLESRHVPDMVMSNYWGIINRTGNELSGIGCSPGSTGGLARVVKDISQARDLKPGEILVAAYTDPGWTPMFLSCKALVTEIGGFLSHGATVAREYGIPAVVNVEGATEKIRTGDYIFVDGTSGQVSICNRQKVRSC